MDVVSVAFILFTLINKYFTSLNDLVLSWIIMWWIVTLWIVIVFFSNFKLQTNQMYHSDIIVVVQRVFTTLIEMKRALKSYFTSNPSLNLNLIHLATTRGRLYPWVKDTQTNVTWSTANAVHCQRTFEGTTNVLQHAPGSSLLLFSS